MRRGSFGEGPGRVAPLDIALRSRSVIRRGCDKRAALVSSDMTFALLLGKGGIEVEYERVDVGPRTATMNGTFGVAR